MRKIFLIVLIFSSIQAMAQLKPIPSGAYHWADLPVTKGTGREGRKIFEGNSDLFDLFEIHATTQQKGAVPAAPHAQQDIEEVIIVKEGTMKFTMDSKSRILGKGSFILIPPLVMQSIQNVGDGPLTYYVMMFRSKKPMDMARSAKGGGPLFLNADSLTYVPSARGGGIKYLDRPTAMCEQLEMHVTELKSKGPSHVPHTHVDTEMLLIIDGDTEIQIDGKTFHASAGDLYFVNSNELHGISNAKDTPCKYYAMRWRW